MSLDLDKYQRLFVEEASEQMAEMERALVGLEKNDDEGAESIDTIFRLAHSLKSMAATVGHDSIAVFAHALEDRMQSIRATGGISGPDELPMLFRALSELEKMLRLIEVNGDAGSPDLAGMAKLFATEAAIDNSMEAMRVHGGYGYSKEFPVERFYRDAPLLTIGEGTNELQRIIIAKQLIQRNPI